MSVNDEIKEAFSGRTLDMAYPDKSHAAECLKLSREKYARPLQEVEKLLREWEEGKPQASEAKQEEATEFEEPLI